MRVGLLAASVILFGASGVLLALASVAACAGEPRVAAPVQPSTPAPLAPTDRVVRGGGSDECASDVDCQLVPSCDCVHCDAAWKMEVQTCGPVACASSACTGLVPACDRGRCNGSTSPRPAVSAVACRRDSDCQAPPCGPCKSRLRVTQEMLAGTCAVNPCPAAEVGCGQDGLCAVK